MNVSYLTPAVCQAVATQWFFIGLATGVASGMILSALLRWMTDSHH